MDIKHAATSPTPVLPDAELDVTHELCPMTFVRTRLALDRLAPGHTLRVRVRGAEARRSVPDNARMLGHQVLAEADDPDGTASILLRRS